MDNQNTENTDIETENTEISKLKKERENNRLEHEKKKDELFNLQTKEQGRIKLEIDKIKEQERIKKIKKIKKKSIIKKQHNIQYVLYVEFSDTIKKNKELLEKYNTRIKNHNKNMIYNNHFDSGFDLFIPNKNIKINKDEVKLVSLDVKCACYKFDIKFNNIPIYRIIQGRVKKGRGTSAQPSPFKIFPRSSMWKKGVLLANCTGIIDSGYRGVLFAPLYSIKDENLIEYNNRYVQICMPGLDRFLIQVVDKLDTNTKRGDGGCGSTGK